VNKAFTTFITGGVRSGKSAFAERLAVKKAKEKQLNLHYIACGVPMDDEMTERIKRHQIDRKKQGLDWKTWEKSTELEKIASSFTKEDLVLVDCLTTLLNNYLFENPTRSWSGVLEQIQQDVNSLRKYAGEVLFVSNEVFEDVPIEEEYTRNYQYILGKTHQYVVSTADTAILVEAGLPRYQKREMKS